MFMGGGDISSLAACVFVQDYDSMVELVEKLPEHQEAQKAPVLVQFAFALNRRNKHDDRDRALTILETVSLYDVPHDTVSISTYKYSVLYADMRTDVHILYCVCCTCIRQLV